MLVDERRGATAERHRDRPLAPRGNGIKNFTINSDPVRKESAEWITKFAQESAEWITTTPRARPPSSRVG